LLANDGFWMVVRHANLERNNLLLALHKYAHQQDENFTTEAFVHLLRHLQVFAPDTTFCLLECLSGGLLRLAAEDCSKLDITTQNTFMQGRPDILISGPAHFVIIEVKVESEPGWGQLDRYREILRERNEHHKRLILLSRYQVARDQSDKIDCHVRWHKIARTLAEVSTKVGETRSIYLIRQFLEFLIERGIAMEKVGWEFVRGVQSLVSLMDMLGDAVRAAKVKEKAGKGGAEFNGRHFTVEDTECWAGIYYAKPQLLTFEAYNVDKTKAETRGKGGWVEKYSKGFKWGKELNLESEDVHFFALSPEGQQSCLERFIVESASVVKNMHA
jgi:hypothetical protein